jgi:hypothetical protein
VSLPFENVREELLRAGVAPRIARRYVIELREHLADLTERERKTGLDATAASRRARELLGTDSQLTQAMLEKTPRTLAARAPWAVFGLLPVVALLAAICVIDISMFHLLTPVYSRWPGGLPTADGGIIAAASFVTGYVLGPAICGACILISLRQRRVSTWLWIGVALIALISSLVGFHMHVLAPTAAYKGGPVFSALAAVYVDGHVSAAATLSWVAIRAAVLVAVAAVTYRILRTRLTASAA